jgi:hypothetical protein
VAGSCEYGNKYSCSIKGGEYLEQLIDCEVISENLVPCDYLYSYRSARALSMLANSVEQHAILS